MAAWSTTQTGQIASQRLAHLADPCDASVYASHPSVYVSHPSSSTYHGHDQDLDIDKDQDKDKNKDKDQIKSPLIDIGINLVHPSLFKDIDNILDKSVKAGITGLIITGTCLKSSKQIVQFISKPPKKVEELVVKPKLWFTVGIHPHDAKTWTDAEETVTGELEKLAVNPLCVAIGECGLDFNRMFSPQPVQEECFIAHIKLAIKLKKPLFLHERDAHDRFLAILREHRPADLPVCVHCFTGNREQLEHYLNEGYYIGITGWITDKKRGKDLFECVKYIPLDKLMVETDAPFLTPHNVKKRPHRNEPSLLPYVVKAIAEAYGVSAEEIAHHTTENAKRFFGIELD